MENKPSSAQIQCENFLRTGRRYSAARRRIFRRFLPQFTTKSRIPRQHRHPYRKFNIKKTPPPKIKFWNWPTSQIQSITPNKTRRGLCLSLSPYQNFSTSGSHPDKHTIKDWREWKTLGKPCVFAWEMGDENESSRDWRWICKCVCVSVWKKQRNWIFNLV